MGSGLRVPPLPPGRPKGHGPAPPARDREGRTPGGREQPTPLRGQAQAGVGLGGVQAPPGGGGVSGAFAAREKSGPRCAARRPRSQPRDSCRTQRGQPGVAGSRGPVAALEQRAQATPEGPRAPLQSERRLRVRDRKGPARPRGLPSSAATEITGQVRNAAPPAPGDTATTPDP